MCRDTEKICCDISFSALLNLCRDTEELCCDINFLSICFLIHMCHNTEKVCCDINKTFLNFHLSLSSLIKHSKQPTFTHTHLNISMNTYLNNQNSSIQVGTLISFLNSICLSLIFRIYFYSNMLTFPQTSEMHCH